jgi:hypothetical protein
MSLAMEHPAEPAPESHLLGNRLAARIGVVAFGAALGLFSAILVTSVPVGLLIGAIATGLWCLTVAVL